MNITTGSILNYLVSPGLFSFGIVYLIKSGFMDYHSKVLLKRWYEIGKSICFLLIFSLLVSCNEGKVNYALPDIRNNPVSVSGNRFIDSSGRQIIFSGLNMINKNPADRYIASDSAETYQRLSEFGMNCIRLGIFWDGVEPEPGRYDEGYLDIVEKQVNMAAENGIYVLIDMHQDLYGAAFGKDNASLGDGAPAWATLTEGLPHYRGEVWSESYLISPAVQKAFDNFWNNTPASDGKGIQDHYALMWKHVAQRFAGNNAVIGYDIMNEPFPGTPGKLFIPLIINEYARLKSEETGKVISSADALKIFSENGKKAEMLQDLKSARNFARVFDAAGDLCREFERTSLQPMYQKVAEAIREIDSTHILFLEHSYFMNTGISSSLEPVREKNGKPDRLTAYSPHGYDLLVDTKLYDDQGNERVEHIFRRAGETAKRTNLPVLVGEWGAFSGNSEAFVNSAAFIINLFEESLFGNTYWSYYPGMENDNYFKKVLIRPYPQYTAGTLVRYGYDESEGVFSCTWDETGDIETPTVIYVPEATVIGRDDITITPSSKKPPVIEQLYPKAGFIIIPSEGKKQSRTIEIRLPF